MKQLAIELPRSEAARAPGNRTDDDLSQSARAVAFMARAPRVVGSIAILTGLTVLYGWAIRSATITSVVANLSPMKTNTAVGFVLAGVALWLRALSPGRRLYAQLASLIAFAILALGTLTIGAYALGWNLGIDEWLLSGSLREAVGGAHRMGLNTASAFALIGTGLLARQRTTSRARILGDLSCSAVFLIGLIAFLGYAYSARSQTGIASYTPMALHTALLFLATSIGVAALPPHGPIVSIAVRDGPGGMLMRRLIPSYTIAVVTLGWIRFFGQSAGWFGLHVGVASFVAASVSVFGMATVWTASAIDRIALLRARAETALRESELRYRTIVDATFDGIVISEEGRIREANAGFAAMFGYQLSELAGKPLLSLLAKESRPELEARLKSGAEGAYQATGIRKNGERIQIEAVVRLQAVGGRQLRVAALRDVTTHRRLEDQVRQAQKMEAVGRLAGGVAHDFNNLLTVISSYAELALDDIEGLRRADLEQIRDAASSAGRLTQQLLAFSRQQALEPRVISLNAVVAGIEPMLARLIGEDIALRVVLASDLRSTVADPGQIEQILLNLAINARDAMPNGGPLTIETSNADLDAVYAQEHRVVEPGRYVLLAVTDTGNGMDEETKRRIFEPFFTTKEQGAGTGLGLATVYGIVKQSGGYIWVYSEIGEGSTFKVYLPATDRSVTAAASIAVPMSSQGSETILLVEDNADVRRVAHEALEARGYKVLEARDGHAALAVAEQHNAPIDLLVSDVVMPGMSGRELAKLLSSRRPELKVLLVSGYPNEALLQRAFVVPGTAILQKPFTPASLTRKVRDVLDMAPSGTDKA